MTTRSTPLELLAAWSRCSVCKTQARVAWIDAEERLRCECWPIAPTLEKLPRGERLVAELIREKEEAQHEPVPCNCTGDHPCPIQPAD